MLDKRIRYWLRNTGGTVAFHFSTVRHLYRSYQTHVVCVCIIFRCKPYNFPKGVEGVLFIFAQSKTPIHIIGIIILKSSYHQHFPIYNPPPPPFFFGEHDTSI
jgi:hypothetical protein